MKTPGRPTLRCLCEDLDADWEVVEDQRAIAGLNGAPATLGKALHELRHPIVKKAAHDFPPDGAEGHRESISGLTTPMWWKVRVGSRWRGAVYEDENGQAWLCAAGYRREGEGADFYKRFMTSVSRRGAEYFLPTPQDVELARRELESIVLDDDEALMNQWEQQLVTWTRTYLSDAVAGDGACDFTIDAADGSQLADVTFVGASHEKGHYGVYVEFQPRNYSALSELEWAEQVMLCAISPYEQVWESTYVGRAKGYSADDLSLAWLDEAGLGPSDKGLPGVASPGDLAHYTHRERLVDSMVDGEAVRALCGRWFVPRQDPESQAGCPSCEAIIANLQGV